jgi:hypothetical protein
LKVKIFSSILKNRSSLLLRWRCSSEFRSRRIGSYFVLVCQISDTVSGFFGGNVNNHSIVTYDWTDGSYSKRPAELEGERLRSSCAVINNKEGESHRIPLPIVLEKKIHFYLVINLFLKSFLIIYFSQAHTMTMHIKL